MSTVRRKNDLKYLYIRTATNEVKTSVTLVITSQNTEHIGFRTPYKKNALFLYAARNILVAINIFKSIRFRRENTIVKKELVNFLRKRFRRRRFRTLFFKLIY